MRRDADRDDRQLRQLAEEYLDALGEAGQREYEASAAAEKAEQMPEEVRQRLRGQLGIGSAAPQSGPVPMRPKASGRPRPLRGLRRLGSLAAVLVILAATVVTAQAAGLDLLGGIARWVELTFHADGWEDPVVSSTAATETAPVELTQPETPPALPPADLQPLLLALRENGIEEALAPAWLPDGFVPADIQTEEEPFSTTVRATYEAADKSEIIAVIIRSHRLGQASELPSGFGEEASGALQFNGRRFRLYQKPGRYTGFWDGGSFSITVIDTLSRDTLIRVLKSIPAPAAS